jgi:3-(3-hydroxy-phenyl)propionate hydroxylase
MKGLAPDALLDTFDADRTFAADENIRNSTRSTDFITPKSAVSRLFRNAALELARTQPFARKLVNSGRLSVPAILVHSALNTPDTDTFAGDMVPGAPMADAPVRAAGQDAWLLPSFGNRFVLMVFVDGDQGLDPEQRAKLLALATAPVPVGLLTVGRGGHVEDAQGLVARRYDARPGTAYLIRPDQHVAARWREVDLPSVQAALDRATAQHHAQARPPAATVVA